MQQAAFINQVVTIAKVVPILIFIVVMAFSFKGDLFSVNFWGGADMPEASLFEQVRQTMLVTVFVFIGIEGASVYSRYAKKRSDVGAATIIGFVAVTAVMVLVTLLPYSVMARADIAGMRQPSMATVLEAVVGHWGAIFISLGLLVSVLGAYLAWSLICAEVLFTAAKTKDMPRVFARGERQQGALRRALADQYRGAAVRHQHLFLARRLLADAQSHQLDVADPVCLRRGLRRSPGAARRNL